MRRVLTVGELIDSLKKYNPDQIVLVNINNKFLVKIDYVRQGKYMKVLHDSYVGLKVSEVDYLK